MKSSTTPDATKTGAPSAGNPPRRPALVLALLAIITIALTGLYLKNRAPALPPSNDPDVRSKFYTARIKSNPNDAEAYVLAALADEDRGYYMSAIDKIESARAHGADRGTTAGVMGRCLAHIDRFDEAAPELEAAVKQNPSDPAAMADLATLQVDAGDPDKGVSTVKSYLAANAAYLDKPQQKDRDTLIRVTQLLERISEHELAFKAASALIQVDSVNVIGMEAAGRALYQMKKIPEAEAMFRRAIAIAPNDAGLQYWLGKALVRIPGKGDEALKLWEKAVSLNPRLTEAYVAAGKELAKRGDHDTAANLLMLAGVGGDNPGTAYFLAAESWARIGKKPQEQFCRAMAAQESGDYGAALPQFQALSSSSSPTWKKRGLDGVAETYRRMGRNREFLDAAQKAAFTNLADDYLRIADAYLMLHNETERANALKKALELDPKLTARIHRELGAYADRGQLQDEAEREYQFAIDADPNNAQYYSDLARVLIKRRTQGDRMQRAVQAAEKAVSVSPNSGDAQYQLGGAYHLAERNEESVPYFQHAIDLKISNSAAYLDLGQAYKALGQKQKSDRAMELYRKLYQASLEKQSLASRAKAFHKDVDAQIQLARFSARNHDFTQAGRSFRAALKLNPNNQEVRSELVKTYRILGILDEAQESDPLLEQGGVMK